MEAILDRILCFNGEVCASPARHTPPPQSVAASVAATTLSQSQPSVSVRPPQASTIQFGSSVQQPVYQGQCYGQQFQSTGGPYSGFGHTYGQQAASVPSFSSGP